MSRNNRVQLAYQRCADGRRALVRVGARSMEVTEDKAGILWERFIVGSGKSVVLFSTPDWWDIFVPLTDDKTTEGTICAIEALVDSKA